GLASRGLLHGDQSLAREAGLLAVFAVARAVRLEARAVQALGALEQLLVLPATERRHVRVVASELVHRVGERDGIAVLQVCGVAARVEEVDLRIAIASRGRGFLAREDQRCDLAGAAFARPGLQAFAAVAGTGAGEH